MSFWEKKFFQNFFDFLVNPVRVPPVKTQKSTSFLRKTNMTVPCVKELPIECISWYDNWMKILDLYKMVHIYIYISSACCASSCNIREGLYIYIYTYLYPAVINCFKVRKFFFHLNNLTYIENHRKLVFE